MKPIYKGATYLFNAVITVNGQVVNIAADKVTVNLGKIYGMTDPTISRLADVTTYGDTGKVIVEFTPEETDIALGKYFLQLVWELDGTTRKFVVLDTTVTVAAQIKK